jgi:lambda repressor-like predicted transcriptional regulator
MADSDDTGDAQDQQQQADQQQAPSDQGDAPTAEDVAALRKALARANDEAKNFRLENRTLKQAQQQALPEAERLAAEAEQRGRQAALGEYGARLARTEFDAAAARRNPDADIASVLEYVDLKRFVDDNGEPDVKAIKAAVARLIPEPAGRRPAATSRHGWLPLPSPR